MTQFKFICPSCGQKILGDATLAGNEVPCPTCRKPLTVPDPTTPIPSGTGPSFASTIALPGIMATVAPSPSQKTLSRLALAALVLCPTGLPGIICGHLALARIRRQPALKGLDLATIALVLAYFFLVAMLVWLALKLLL
jgi:Domain of unknown function (DUF4190)